MVEMLNQQQARSHNQQYSARSLSYSIVSSPSSLTNLQIKLPPISQPLISRYRNQRVRTNLFTTNKPLISMNFLRQLFCGKQSQTSVSMCVMCQRSKQLQLCSYILELIEEKYNWKEDIKFRNSYQFYNRKKISIFLSDQQIEYRLMSKFNILGVVLLDNHKLLLMRIVKNYIKHTIYYGEEQKLTAQNDYYFWFLIGIYYHVGVPKYFSELQSLPKDSVGVHQPIMFWMLDMVMKRLSDCTQNKLRTISQLTFQYCQIFYQRQCKCLASYDINLAQIMYEWTNEGMMGYMGIEFIGFYINSILKEGYQYIQKTIMSYFQKRVVKLDRDQIISFHHGNNYNSSAKSHGYDKINGNMNGVSTLSEQTKRNKKQQILRVLLDSSEQWPGIFFSTNVYDLKK